MILPETIQSPYFKFSNVSGTYTLPPNSPDIGDLTDFCASVTFTTYENVLIPPDIHKLFIQGSIHFKFHYSNAKLVSSIHSLNHIHPFSLYITIPSKIKNEIFNLHAIIEDTYSTCLSTRNLYYNLTFVVIASSATIKGGNVYE